MSYHTHCKQQSACSARSIPVGLPEMVDAEHRQVHHQIQLPVYISPVPDAQILMGTLAISGCYWMHTPICLPYSSQESYSGSKNSSAASCSSLQLAALSVVPISIMSGRFQYTTTTRLGPTSFSFITQIAPPEFVETVPTTCMGLMSK